MSQSNSLTSPQINYVKRNLWSIVKHKAASLVSSIWSSIVERRIHTYQKLAMEHDFLFHESGITISEKWFLRFPLFRSQFGCQVQYVLTGRFLNKHVQTFEFRPNDDLTPFTTIFAFEVGTQKLPMFAMWPAGTHACPNKAMGINAHEVKIPDVNAIGTKYELFCAQPETIKPLFSPKAAKFFDRNSNQGWHIEGGGQYILIYKPGLNPTPRKLTRALRDAHQVFAALKV